MEIDLTPEQTEFVRHAIAAGRIQNSVEAIQEAMTLWVERERRIEAAAHARSRLSNPPLAPDKAAARILERRSRHVLPEGMTIRDLMTYGRA